MHVQALHHEDEDFGTLTITFDADDDVSLAWENGRAILTLPVYNYEAQELASALEPIRQSETLA